MSDHSISARIRGLPRIRASQESLSLIHIPIWICTQRLQGLSVRSAYASQEAHTKVVSRRDTRVNVPYDWLVSASISRSTERTVVQSMCRWNSGSLATPQHTRSALQDTGILKEASLALGNAKRHFVLRETSCACRAGIGTGTHVSI